jgi:hypothetical protein
MSKTPMTDAAAVVVNTVSAGNPEGSPQRFVTLEFSGGLEIDAREMARLIGGAFDLEAMEREGNTEQRFAVLLARKYGAA